MAVQRLSAWQEFCELRYLTSLPRVLARRRGGLIVPNQDIVSPTEIKLKYPREESCHHLESDDEECVISSLPCNTEINTAAQSDVSVDLLQHDGLHAYLNSRTPDGD
ncbi:unnamed protein product [Pleuronectes platessa]|uniref:Uncharacterized protein n=1 Tax=Pleuronectes platessa TaxID=8262 RepID=A0A9N7YGM2_PLEPL|nr:unnamed protein product [Pleuronectes platessa]